MDANPVEPAIRLSDRCFADVRGRMCRNRPRHWIVDGAWCIGYCTFHWNRMPHA